MSEVEERISALQDQLADMLGDVDGDEEDAEGGESNTPPVVVCEFWDRYNELVAPVVSGAQRALFQSDPEQVRTLGRNLRHGMNISMRYNPQEGRWEVDNEAAGVRSGIRLVIDEVDPHHTTTRAIFGGVATEEIAARRDDPNQVLVWDEMEQALPHPEGIDHCSCQEPPYNQPCTWCTGTCPECGTWNDSGINMNDSGDCLVCLGDLAPAQY